MPNRPHTWLMLLLAALFWQAAALAADVAARTTSAASPKTPALKTVTSFSRALHCMDELFLGYGKQGIVITSAGIPDETGKVKTGTKEMVITALAKMTLKSNAFEFIDFHSQGDDLKSMFDAMGDQHRKLPDYYLRGSITQMDDNVIRRSKGAGSAVPLSFGANRDDFVDYGAAKDEAFDMISMDLSIGEAATRKILPATSTSNTLVIVKQGKSDEGGSKLGKLGLSFNLDTSRSEGFGAATRSLLELGMIETLGKFTQVPYWRCLDNDLSNPLFRDQAAEYYDSLSPGERILFIQRKLGGSMNRYAGPIDGLGSEALKTAIAEYQAQAGLVANGSIDFDLYASLLDDTQNLLAALPAKATPPAPLPSSANSPTVGFRMTLESERGTRPNFTVGEFLSMRLSLSGTGSVYCYYQDAAGETARIFPNQFHADATLMAGGIVKLPGNGFRIRFDQAGQERVACIAADRELVVPAALSGIADLRPTGRPLDDILSQFMVNNPAAISASIDILVTR